MRTLWPPVSRLRSWLLGAVLVVASNVTAHESQLSKGQSSNASRPAADLSFFSEDVVPLLNRARDIWMLPGQVPGTARVSYVLPEPAFVTVLLRQQGSQSLLLHRVLAFHVPQQPGKHILDWDGRDASGLPVDIGKVYVKVHTEPLELTLPEHQRQLITEDPDHLRGHVHVFHSLAECGLLDLTLGSSELTKPLSGTVNLAASFGNDFRGRGRTWGMGVRIYVDNQLVTEFYLDEKQASGSEIPFSLDTRGFADGEHVIMVNCCDHNEHEGIASARVRFHNGVQEDVR